VSRILKILAILNLLVFSIIILDFTATPVISANQIKQFGGYEIASGKGYRVQHYIQMADGERIYLAKRSKFEDLENIPARVYKTKYLGSNRWIEIQVNPITSLEDTSMFGDFLFIIIFIA